MQGDNTDSLPVTFANSLLACQFCHLIIIFEIVISAFIILSNLRSFQTINLLSSCHLQRILKTTKGSLIPSEEKVLFIQIREGDNADSWLISFASLPTVFRIQKVCKV